jgi:DNA-binding response OmpR family regulator
MTKILIVEDDKTLCKTIKIALESENYQVIAANDGREGFHLGSQKKLDLIILDLILPSMTGFEICTKLREMGNKTPMRKKKKSIKSWG